MTHSAELQHDRSALDTPLARAGVAGTGMPWGSTAGATATTTFDWATEATAPRNAVLGALSPDDFAAVAPYLEPVALTAEQVVFGAGSAGTHLYFPESAVIAIMREGGDGARPVCVDTVGSEGSVGLPLLLGVDSGRESGMVLVGGEATRLEVGTLRRLAEERPAVRRVLDQHMAMTLAQLAQTAVCDRTHSVEQRLARLLLVTRDQVGSHRLPMTHEALAAVLGVRRASVTEAACALRGLGAIDYQRGRLVVRDGAALVGAACGCYGILRETFAGQYAGPGVV